MLCLEGVGGGCGVRRLNTLGRSEAELRSGSLRKSLVAGALQVARGVLAEGPPRCLIAKVPAASLAQLCCGVWYNQHPTTSARLGLGGRLGGILLHSHTQLEIAGCAWQWAAGDAVEWLLVLTLLVRRKPV